MHKHKKAIIGVVFILVFAISFITVPQAFAVETKVEEFDTAEKYGLYIDKVSDNRYEVVMDEAAAGDKKASDFSKAKFKIVEINGVPVEMDDILSSSNNSVIFMGDTIIEGTKHYVSIKLERMGLTADDLTEEFKLVEQYISLEYSRTEEIAVGGTINLVNNDHYYGKCAEFRAEGQSLGTEGDSFYRQQFPYCYQQQVRTNYSTAQLNSRINTVKSLWNNIQNSYATSPGDFDLFKNNVLNYASSNNYSGRELPSSISLKCDYQKTQTASNESEIEYPANKYGEIIKSTEYYLNKDYYYKSQTEKTGGTVKYTYNYAPGKTSEVIQDSCERTCEEAVKVEYGPPVASKAGLCFEYKVKVTSYVKCSTKVTATPPTEPDLSNYCNPAPSCKNVKGTIINKLQAGPSEEFDQCIKECDGGKYSEKCSIKCYQKVYGKSLTKMALNYEDYQATKLASSSYSLEQCLEDNKDYYGCYVYNNGATTWSAYNTYKNGSHDYHAIESLGRWYILKYQNGTYTKYNIASELASGGFVADTSGFFREDFGNSLCTDICYWKTSSCGSNQYLNPGTMITDYEKNRDAYDSAVEACVGSATCSESTAEFKISVKYDYKSGDTVQTKTIEFPYETKDQLHANQANSLDSSRTSILAYDGCYKDNEIGNYYMTEWSFPGTYIHNKTGAVSYEPETTEGWAFEDKRFCMPLNALSVNPKWWEWKTMDNSCYGPAEIQAELNSTDGANGYNISAQAENFGYFGWNFDIGCFYAIRNEVCIPEDKCCKKITCTPGDPGCDDGSSTQTTSAYDYTFRTVDIDNLFPNAEENPTVGSDKREIGFNWTSKATGADIGSTYYTINPSQLINDIQNNSSTLYSDDNKDYEFYLTPEDLKTIRKYNKNKESGAGKGYSEWGGSTYERNGVNTYFSNLFRPEGEGQILTRSGVIKQTGEPGKNNQ